MRKLIIGLLFAFSSVVTIAQNNSDPQFSKRLDEYMKLTQELKFDEIMEYTHPKMFTIASKEQLVEVFKNAFDNEAMSISIDSATVAGISEDFRFENAVYKKIDYSLKVIIRLKDTSSLNDENYINVMKNALASGFPGGSVEFNKAEKHFQIKASNIMIAIKDNNDTLWMFLGYEEKNTELVKRLYPQEVVDHFKLL